MIGAMRSFTALRMTVCATNSSFHDSDSIVRLRSIHRAETRYGFMERPDIPDLLRVTKSLGCTVDLDDVTYYVGHETVVRREDGKGLPAWQEAIFTLMERNAVHVSDFFSLPSDQVVEIGRQVSI